MTSGPGPVLEAHGISLQYAGQSAPVLKDFDFSLGKSEVVTLLGPSGVGKSSLLRVLAGLQAPASGTIRIDGEALSDVHPRLAMNFQNPGLLPWLDLEKNVAFGLDFARQQKLSREERQNRIDAAIAEVGLDHARRRRPSELSGGMAQRAALARCLARKPEVLLLDEPFGALDEITRAEMQDLLLKVVRDLRTSAVLVTHDIDEALLVSDRIILLGGSPGREIGQWTIDLPKPRHDAVSELGRLRIDILSTLRNARLHH
ncbi:ABC transporter ATP-binding protein [Tianweitania sp.]|uniref:ABC transporter ATP-binding protein n=1 Tax=Tianweitania sp. TaxID=2021634 RepID=UPI00289CBFE5|nr:ABC transporter ATP-binding protein [Tianweitania sp.]